MANNYLGSFATGTIAQGIQIGSSLALLPIIGIYLSPEEIGIWYILLTFQSLTLLIDSGSLQGFIRFYSLARSGASGFTSDGFEISDDISVGGNLESKVLAINRFVHLLIAVFFLFLGLPLIWLLIAWDLSNDTNLVTLVFGCFVFGIGSVVYLSASWMSAFLFSLELQSVFFRFLILYRLIFFVVAAAMLFLDFGVLGLGVANLLSVIVAIAYLRSRFRKVAHHDLFSGTCDMALVSDLWKVWAKNVVAALSGFLGNRGVLIVVASAYGLSTAGMFGISMQLFFAVLAVSQLVFQISVPRMSKLRVEKRLVALRGFVTRLAFCFLILFTAGAAAVIFLIPFLLELVDSNIQFLAFGPLLLMGFIYGLEGNHSNFALAISTENRIPYFFPSIITAIVILLGTIIVSFNGLPIIWVLVVQGGAHLLYNNWKWPSMFYGSIRANLKVSN